MGNKVREIFSGKRIVSIIKTPIVVAISILLVGIGLFCGMYATIQDNFLRTTSEHEMKVMSVVERLASEAIDAKLEELKGYCIDMLIPMELGLLPTDMEEREALLQMLSLPEDGLNLAYWSGAALISRDDSFRAGLEALDLASVAEKKDAVIFNPYFDEEGRYILTVAAATEESSGVFLVQYDGFCLSRWLGATVAPLGYGTAYIVDDEGYNIAAAREEEREWVTTRYNAQLYAQENPNTQNVSVATLEKLALEGERGIGTYEWDGGLSYVAYGPLTEAPWGYYVGFYEWELLAYTKNVVAISGRSSVMMLMSFGAFMGLIVVLLFRSLTRERKYNQEIQFQRMEAERRSRQDPLTGMRNKLEWQEAVQRLDEQIRAGEAQFAIVVCDVNGLKRVNDLMGHEDGDNLIVNASRYICKIFPESPVYRIGGDEFTVVLQGKELETCEQRVEQFNAGLAQPDAALSIALGVAQYQSEDMTCADVFQRADKAMYRKKAEMKEKRENK